jgi:hypothetical protein
MLYEEWEHKGQMTWFSAIGATNGMIFLRLALFERLGLTFSLPKLIPWLYTLPIPVAVLAATTATTAWKLSKLDPVSIIDRRQDHQDCMFSGGWAA